MVVAQFDAGRAGLAGIVELLHRLQADLGDVVDVVGQRVGVLDVAEHVGRQGAVRIGADDVLFETDRAFHGELLDEARHGLRAVVGREGLPGARKGEVVHQRERQGATLAQMTAKFLDVDLAFGRGGDRGQLGQGLPTLGARAIRLVDDEPDLVEPSLQHADTRILHDLLAVDAHGVAGFLGGDQPEVFRAEFLLQRGEVGLDAPTRPVVDQRETVAVVDPAAGRRTQHDATALGVRLFLEVAGLDELAEGEPADHVDESGEEKEEHAVETETLDRGRGQDARVGRFFHGMSGAGGTPRRSKAEFCVRAIGIRPIVPTTPASSSWTQRCPARSATDTAAP